MTEERLKEIKDGIVLQYILAKAKNIDNALLFTDEEQELYDEVIRLKERINKVIEHLEMNIEHGCDATICEQIDFLNTLTGSDKE